MRGEIQWDASLYLVPYSADDRLFNYRNLYVCTGSYLTAYQKNARAPEWTSYLNTVNTIDYWLVLNFVTVIWGEW